ncbi:hypothetical protein ECENHK_18210 [Enterobacter kobei]|nr:hypothetical protein ECENHK_18210 [Enterobacter kobei]
MSCNWRNKAHRGEEPEREKPPGHSYRTPRGWLKHTLRLCTQRDAMSCKTAILETHRITLCVYFTIIYAKLQQIDQLIVDFHIGMCIGRGLWVV